MASMSECKRTTCGRHIRQYILYITGCVDIGSRWWRCWLMLMLTIRISAMPVLHVYINTPANWIFTAMSGGLSRVMMGQWWHAAWWMERATPRHSMSLSHTNPSYAHKHNDIDDTAHITLHIHRWWLQVIWGDSHGQQSADENWTQNKSKCFWIDVDGFLLTRFIRTSQLKILRNLIAFTLFAWANVLHPL